MSAVENDPPLPTARRQRRRRRCERRFALTLLHPRSLLFPVAWYSEHVNGNSRPSTPNDDIHVPARHEERAAATTETAVACLPAERADRTSGPVPVTAASPSGTALSRCSGLTGLLGSVGTPTSPARSGLGSPAAAGPSLPAGRVGGRRTLPPLVRPIDPCRVVVHEPPHVTPAAAAELVPCRDRTTAPPRPMLLASASTPGLPEPAAVASIRRRSKSPSFSWDLGRLKPSLSISALAVTPSSNKRVTFSWDIRVTESPSAPPQAEAEPRLPGSQRLLRLPPARTSPPAAGQRALGGHHSPPVQPSLTQDDSVRRFSSGKEPESEKGAAASRAIPLRLMPLPDRRRTSRLLFPPPVSHASSLSPSSSSPSSPPTPHSASASETVERSLLRTPLVSTNDHA